MAGPAQTFGATDWGRPWRRGLGWCVVLGLGVDGCEGHGRSDGLDATWARWVDGDDDDVREGRADGWAGWLHDGVDVHRADRLDGDRKSTRLNSSHANISYAVF